MAGRERRGRGAPFRGVHQELGQVDVSGSVVVVGVRPARAGRWSPCEKSVGSQSRGQRQGCPWPGISEACYSPNDWSTKASRRDMTSVGASRSCTLACDANAPQATLPINAAHLQPLASPAKKVEMEFTAHHVLCQWSRMSARVACPRA